MQKWLRSYYLTVQVEDGKDEFVHITMPMTIHFHIKRDINSSCNTATITVLNLAEDTRRKVFLDNYKNMYYKRVELRAGYPDIGLKASRIDKERAWEFEQVLPLIFKGNIQNAYSRRNSVNYETTIHALDGGFAYVNGYSSRQFAQSTTDKQMLNTLVADLPHIEKGKIGNFNVSLTRSNTLDVPTIQAIQDISEGNWFIDLETLHCLLPNEAFEGNIKVLDASCGLMGTPLRQESFLTFEMMFEPRLQIGQAIEVKAETETIYNGTYRVVGVEHTGIISDAQSGACKTKVSLAYCSTTPVIL